MAVSALHTNWKASTLLYRLQSLVMTICPGAFKSFFICTAVRYIATMSQNEIPSLTNRLGSETVTLRVGPSFEIFKIHKNLICKIEFFNKDFNGRFLECSGTISLPEDDPTVIHLLVDYLYLGSIPCPPTTSLEPDDAIKLKKQHILNLFSLYVFAEKINDKALMNKTIDTTQSLCFAESFTITLNALLAVYENTKPTSKLRLFTCELYIYVFRKQNNGDMPADEIRTLISYVKDEDLLVDLFLKKGGRNLPDHRTKRINELCYFHTGCEEEGCCDALSAWMVWLRSQI